MKKIAIIISALLVVGVAALLPVPSTQASCTYLCAPIYCSDGQYFYRSGGGDASLVLRYLVHCNGGSCNPSGCYVECQEFPCASVSGTLYTNVGGRILAIQIADHEQGNRIGDFIQKNKTLSAELMLRTMRSNYGVGGKVLNLEAFNNRPALKGCPA